MSTRFSFALLFSPISAALEMTRPLCLSAGKEWIMTVKLNARGSVEELRALYNLLNDSTEQVTSLKSGMLARDKDITNGKQTFELTLKGSTRYEPKQYRPRREIAGEVYLLETDRSGVYKIGQTKDFQDRKATFNVKLPFPVKLIHIIECSDRFTMERYLKAKYRKEGKCLNRSEFFQLTAEDVAYILSL
jgi:hypothetical protein